MGKRKRLVMGVSVIATIAVVTTSIVIGFGTLTETAILPGM